MQNRSSPRPPSNGHNRPPPQGLVQVGGEPDASDIDIVVRSTKRLRQRLSDDLGATGLSFHECLDSLQGRIPDEDMRRLRFIATVRNRILNDVGRDSLDNRAGFLQAVEQADAAISLQAAAWRARTVAAGSSGAATGKGKAGCFIATAVFPDSDAPQLTTLRRFRDETLMRSGTGRSLVRLYYRLSPPLATWLAGRPGPASAVRRMLNAWVQRLDRG